MNKKRILNFNQMGNDKHIYIVAEIGINHNGSIEYAKELIDIAASCNCDAVKFQKRDIEIVYGEELLSDGEEF